ncbi:squalene/phytoene synthase family protein [Porphyrobacter sp. AAP60]|uniref:squalene/phytoene synthase family protein n=1 Tax=Porphyrobacter sp. AAP60 TaxID=1523423 RepID=UPI000AE8BF00|nr:squalene/phytoene synthase family protein [Porphyrobacter sp. AAP60]
MMPFDSSDPLPPEADLALAWSPPAVRGPMAAAFQLDRRLARIVARTTEPMLGQMRLAWWRDALGKPVADRPRGDVVLDAISAEWAGREAALATMVDGWEVLVTADQLDRDAIEGFGAQRSAIFGALDGDLRPAEAEMVAAAGFRWALADAAGSVSDAGERAMLIDAGLGRSAPRGRMPRPLRGLAVLNALAVRSLQRGGRPMMEGRGAPLIAMRAAIFLT